MGEINDSEDSRVDTKSLRKTMFQKDKALAFVTKKAMDNLVIDSGFFVGSQRGR